MLCLSSLANIQVLCAGPSWKSLQWGLYSRLLTKFVCFFTRERNQRKFQSNRHHWWIFLSQQRKCTRLALAAPVTASRRWRGPGGDAGRGGGLRLWCERRPKPAVGGSGPGPTWAAEGVRPIEDPEWEIAPKMLGMFYTLKRQPQQICLHQQPIPNGASPVTSARPWTFPSPLLCLCHSTVSAVISTNSTCMVNPPKELQFLSSLAAFPGSESGDWPEEEKPLSAETYR